MKLRFYQTYDKNGVNSEKTLQYYDEDLEFWNDIEFVREPYPYDQEEEE